MRFIDEIKNDIKKNTIGFILLSFVLILFIVIKVNLLDKLIPQLWQYILFVFVYLITLFFIMKPIVMSDEDNRNIIEGWDFYYRFYTGVGYSTVSAGLVSIVILPKGYFISLAITLMGILFIIIGEMKLSKKRKFELETTKARKFFQK